MVGVLGPKPGKEHFPVIGPAVPVSVAEMKEFFPVGDIGTPASIGQDPSRDDELIVIDGGLVCRTVSVRVLQDQDPVAGILVHVQLRIGLTAGDPEPSLAVEGDLGGLRQQGVSSPQVDLEALGDLEGGLLDLRVGRGNVPQVTLGLGRERQEGQCNWEENEGVLHLRVSSCSRIRSSCAVTKGSNFAGSVWATACSFLRSP